MTYDEIVTRISYQMFPDANVPSATSSALAGDSGLIAFSHKNLQRHYNLWFMEATHEFTLVEDQLRYSLPDDFKEIISLLNYDVSEEKYGNEVHPIGRYTSAPSQWPRNSSTYPHPAYYEVVGSNILFYPVSDDSANKVAMLYYRFIPFSTGETLVMENAGEILVDMVCAEVADARKEFDDSQIYRQRAGEKLLLLRQEDHSRREAYFRSMGAGY